MVEGGGQNSEEVARLETKEFPERAVDSLANGGARIFGSLHVGTSSFVAADLRSRLQSFSGPCNRFRKSRFFRAI
jgi:hypothetical protein